MQLMSKLSLATVAQQEGRSLHPPAAGSLASVLARDRLCCAAQPRLCLCQAGWQQTGASPALNLQSCPCTSQPGLHKPAGPAAKPEGEWAAWLLVIALEALLEQQATLAVNCFLGPAA